MNDQYCYDSQLSSIESELISLNEKLDKLIQILDPSNKCSCCNRPFEKYYQRIIDSIEENSRYAELPLEERKKRYEERLERYGITIKSDN